MDNPIPASECTITPENIPGIAPQLGPGYPSWDFEVEEYPNLSFRVAKTAPDKRFRVSISEPLDKTGAFNRANYYADTFEQALNGALEEFDEDPPVCPRCGYVSYAEENGNTLLHDRCTTEPNHGDPVGVGPERA